MNCQFCGAQLFCPDCRGLQDHHPAALYQKVVNRIDELMSLEVASGNLGLPDYQMEELRNLSNLVNSFEERARAGVSGSS